MKDDQLVSRRFLLTGVMACAGCASVSKNTDSISRAEYAILQDILGTDSCDFKNAKFNIVLDTIKIVEHSDEYLASKFHKTGMVGRYSFKGNEYLGKIGSDTIDDFFRKNTRSWRLNEAALKGGCESYVTYVEASKIEEMLEQQSDEEIFENPATHLYYSSRFGFNESKSEAIGYYEHSCGGLCASGMYVAARKTNDGVWDYKYSWAWIS
ncbi:MAG: hypothetical protein DHS20C05_01980 [Hyphococcus sp.]|nr:MAG: hypothetical protein DHS20C05_01980 [Marinicaulis sp.]